MFEKHAASNSNLSEGIDATSVVSSLNGLEKSFQQLGQFIEDEHVKPEPMD